MIKIEKLTKKFDEKILFENFSLEIDDGEFVILCGPSGCGKTTILNIIGSLEPFDSGSVRVDGIDVSDRKNQLNFLRTKVGFLFQNFALAESKTVKQNMEFIKKSCRTGISIDEALSKVGLEEASDKKVYTLSGGEQQRVALARLLIKKCDLVLADEPTGSLDHLNAMTVMELLKKMNEDGKTVVTVTHDERLKGFADRVIYL